MKFTRHGLSIGIERVDSTFFLTLKIAGRLTHDDYNTLIPILEGALQEVQSPSINALVDITLLEGWELRAAWDDLKLGLRHGSEFRRIAIVGNKKWEEIMAKVGSWFIAGEIKYYEDELSAYRWLHQEADPATG
jgi:hypothetical protein